MPMLLTESYNDLSHIKAFTNVVHVRCHTMISQITSYTTSELKCDERVSINEVCRMRKYNVIVLCPLKEYHVIFFIFTLEQIIVLN